MSFASVSRSASGSPLPTEPPSPVLESSSTYPLALTASTGSSVVYVYASSPIPLTALNLYSVLLKSARAAS